MKNNLNMIEKLKIEIMSKGVSICEDAQNELTKNNKIPLSLFEYPTTAGISLVLPKNIYVNAQFSGKYSSSKIKLKLIKDSFYIQNNYKKYKVKIIPLPSYINLKNSLWKNVIMSHADRMRINPIIGCAFRCKFCDCHKEKYKKNSIKNILSAIDIALQDKNIQPKHLLISGGTPKKNDIPYLDNVYRVVTEYLREKNIPVDIMLAPRKEKMFLEKLKKWGVNALAINLEVYNEKIAKIVIPQKHAIARNFYFHFIKQAVEVFGKGKVRSLLLVGLEPISETLKGVEEISKLGCDVVLSPFVPGEKTNLFKLYPPMSEDLKKVYIEAKKITERCGVKMGPRCIPCQHNTLSFPDNSGEYYFS